MKLFYSPGACSLASHIALQESGLQFEAVTIDLKTHTMSDGSDYRSVNPKGYVPFLVLDDGQGLSEGPAIIQYIADQVPAKGLIPAAGTMARYRAIEWLNFISTELHKSFTPLFMATMPAEGKELFRTRLKARYAVVDERLKASPYLLGDSFSVADAYLFTITNWCGLVGVDISDCANVQAFMARIAARPTVQAAMKAEGLIK